MADGINSLATQPIKLINVNPNGNNFSEQPGSNNVPIGSWRDNPNYKFTLYNPGAALAEDRVVEAYLPETFELRLSSTWEQFLHDGGGNVFEAVNSATQSIWGTSINIKLLSALIWKRSEPLSFTFNIFFDAKTSAKKDVTEPVMRLMQMISPKRNGIFLTAPGPTIASQANRISLTIGRFFYLDSVVLEEMGVTWHTAAEYSGDFIAADVTLQIKGWYTPDEADIKNYFGLGDNSEVRSYLKSVSHNFANGPEIFKVGSSELGKAIADRNLAGVTAAVSDAATSAKNLFFGSRNP